MNVDSNSECQVVSKYFTGNTVMDESLTEFKEKKSFQGPKNVKAIKPKAKKAGKKIKGQKDIRIALKPKKNELIAYAKDFDTVCKKSGIDVDSEQLQLAIALSKSLEQSESVDSPSTSQSLSAQQRTGLIRTTLKEYGFKVPEAKAITSRKNKKRRKPYKLLLTTVDQKQQIISDRYTQLLFELNNSTTVSGRVDSDTTSLVLYNMATNIDYDNIKNDDVFYVDDLIEKSPNTMGCLLKDWSDIPGRPTSPVQDKSEIIFSEIECSQDEVDIVLSGSLKYSKDLLKRRNLYNRKSVVCTIVDEVVDKSHEENNHPVIIACDELSSPKAPLVASECKNKPAVKDIEAIVVPDKQMLTVPPRSLSPDLFDDDDDDTIVEIVEDSPVKQVTNDTKGTSSVMDLTECVNVTSKRCINSYSNIKLLSQPSQEVDVTKRKSNDFMEMTECVGASSQPILQTIEEHIDLTAHCVNDVVIEKKSICVENMDNVEHMDLTQSSNSSTDSLPFVHIMSKENLPEKSLDDTIILNDNDYKEVDTLKINEVLNDNTDDLNADNDRLEAHTTELETNADDVIDINLRETHLEVPKDTLIINLDESCVVGSIEDNVDLTQSSKSYNSEIGSPPKHTNHCINNSSLGKKDDVSVDYDEALENMNYYTDYAHVSNFNDDIENYPLNKSKTDKEITINNSKHSEVVELSESELKSPNKVLNVEYNFDIGGISVINNLPSFNRESRNTMNSIPNGSIMSESLPMVHIDGKQSPTIPKSTFEEFPDPILDHINNRSLIINNPSSETQTPKEANKEIAVETPKQSKYIVKTDNVTPMVDYEAMSSPERNRELDKYGLKPFKRKRAIQLLTHLYNQTHPFVESTEELTSPSKKRLLDCLPSTSKSPKKLAKSPRKNSKSQRNNSKSPRNDSEDSGSLNDANKENDIFMVTSEVPALRIIECDADDWVFQKREKAKVHTCRVPLHIAFHNYVSCRRLLHEAILRYEPVNIDVIHKELAASGHRYDPKDLLKFMDKKCITVKTADNLKNKNRY